MQVVLQQSGPNLCLVRGHSAIQFCIVLDLLTFLKEHPKKEWSVVKSAPSSFLVACALVGFVCWVGMDWRYSAVVAHKEATIEGFEKALQLTEKDNERLNSQVAELRTYRGQDALPLKKKALILSKQVKEFTSAWKESDPSIVQDENAQKYIKRFGLRASILRDDLDQNGQQSDALDKAIFQFSYNHRDVGIIAAEVERLASRLPD